MSTPFLAKIAFSNSSAQSFTMHLSHLLRGCILGCGLLQDQSSFPAPNPNSDQPAGQLADYDAELRLPNGRVDVDTKVKKPSTEEGAPASEGLDWGAGRLVHVDVLGVRLAVDHEKTAVLEQRKPGGGSARSR